jgi:hypothetical protein
VAEAEWRALTSEAHHGSQRHGVHIGRGPAA